MFSALALILFMQAPNYTVQRPVVTSSAYACRLEYDALASYQAKAFGSVSRRRVDRRGGDIEFPDQVEIEAQIEWAIRPYVRELQEEALVASPGRCREIRMNGQKAVNAVLIRFFNNPTSK